MTTAEPTSTQSPPLIGRLVHLSVQAAGIAGPAWFGWELGGGGISGAALALLVCAAFAFLWFGTHAAVDPEPNPLGFVPIRGRIRFALEIALIIAGGSALWMAWNRAAGETFLTAAFIDFVIRYPRLATLVRDR